ncbi:MAG: (NiFe) hydrogenase maturation protein HypF [Bryobacterales bacterium]|nr:(NiFe) hydrogenase maturation protein HypF [Bryobacterales bacterium]
MLEGVVQGVGFRPFVKKLADRLELPGITFNTARGLVVEIDSTHEGEARHFIAALRAEAPPASRVERCVVEEIAQRACYEGFRITPSAARDGSFTLISPDLATCDACLAEITNPADRRFRYPFTNCTNCGPRYSITLSTPYDRANTTMKRFELCDACAAEYADPADRRFHAEPVACPVCGPRLSMEICDALPMVEEGRILALKGLGGFQLACDAFCAEAVDELRLRKRRSRKPFAVMMRDMATVERYCVVGDADRHLLGQTAAPVVLLSMRDPAAFPPGVAPGLRHLGVMLPYTPLHHLLLGGSATCLVMTSGNISEEPIVIRNEEAIEKLGPLADGLLLHDRDIFMRVDDSVARTFEGVPRVLRRARGYAPSAIALGHEVGEVLATGGELKNTFCITKGRYAIPSQHIGDLENYETVQFFEETLRNLQSVYQAKPRLIAHDLHPDYLSTRWALTRPEPKIAVQHHHAHIASCMAENGLSERVIGVAFDGTGFGSDGQVWGGEFMICDYGGYERWAHLRYVSLPGGDRAAREGWRMAAAHLYDALGPEFRRLDLPCWSGASAASWKVLERMIERPAIMTSSCGRLFDAVSAICGISVESSYEGESAMLLEAAAEGQSGESYKLELNTQTVPWTIETRSMIERIAREIAAGQSGRVVARCFHDSIARMIESVCSSLRERNSVDKVCLSGGAFQNFTLLSDATALLRRSGFEVFLHSQVPPNDGGLSLGQAVIAATYLKDMS